MDSGGQFAEITLETKELSIVEKIWLLIHEVVTSIAELVSAYFDELMKCAISGNRHLKIYLNHIYSGKKPPKCQKLKLKKHFRMGDFYQIVCISL